MSGGKTMSSAGTHPRPNVRPDDLFFPGMAAAALVVVLVGFARTYFLAGLFWAPLPNMLVHVHAAAFTSWIVLLIAQTSLVAAGRTDLHRRLGQLGFALAAIMIVLGLITASDRVVRDSASPGPGGIEGVYDLYAVSIGGMLMFCTFVYAGYRNRFRPEVHKRLMLFATFSLLDAGFDRWPVFDPYPLPVVNLICFTPLVLLMMGYDRWSTGRVQRVTLWSTLFLFTVQQGRHLVSATAAWHSFTVWVQLHMPSFS
jgi:energy-converting hydrogenase Eha subunit A